MIDSIKQNAPYDLIFFGLGQNCQQYISFFLAEAKKISQKYKTKLIIGENGSTDDTFSEIQKELLNQDQPLDLDFVDTTFVEKYSDRVVRLSKARQKLLDHIKKKNIQAKYICVIDLDNVLDQSLIEENIKKMILILEKNKKQYFAVSAKSKPYYYDILNFEDQENSNLDILDLMNDKKISSYFKRKKKIYFLQDKLTRLGNIESISSFNGMCLYFFNEYIKSTYYCLDSNGKIIPEHLNLNRIIARNTGKKILISEDILLSMPAEHKPLFNIINFLTSKIYKYFHLLKKNLTK
jgi:hypothetical protein